MQYAVLGNELSDERKYSFEGYAEAFLLTSSRTKLLRLVFSLAVICLAWGVTSVGMFLAALNGMVDLYGEIVTAFTSCLVPPLFVHTIIVLKTGKITARGVLFLYTTAGICFLCMTNAIFADGTLQGYYHTWSLKMIYIYCICYWGAASVILHRWWTAAAEMAEKHIILIMAATGSFAMLVGMLTNTFRILIDARLEIMVLMSPLIVLCGLLAVYSLLNISKSERDVFSTELEKSRFTDDLTGFETFLSLELLDCTMEKSSLAKSAMVVVDFDGLAVINQQYGYFTGDYSLLRLKDAISEIFCDCCKFFRVYGDEFAIFVEDFSFDTLKDMLINFEKNICAVDREMKYSFQVTYGVGEGNIASSMLEMLHNAEAEMQSKKLFSDKSSKNSLITALENIVQIKDSYTAGHTDRLLNYVKEFFAMPAFQTSRQKLMLLAKFHDIGKMGIPDYVLFKNSALTCDEMEIVKEHCKLGRDLAVTVPELADIADLILYHHERWDGKGYPAGLQETDIPVECRLMSLIDSFDVSD